MTLIERLRSYGAAGYTHEAADKIERLTAELAVLKAGPPTLEQMGKKSFADLWISYCDRKSECENLKDELAEVKAERDALKETCRRAKGAITALMHSTPIRDLDETLAELDVAIKEQQHGSK